jgi:plasmid replication initiation protein
MSLPSIYSQKLYEMLRSYDDQQDAVVSVKELHDILQTKSHAQRSYAEFNRRILKPAHKHITELTSLKYEYEPIKKGRKYAEIRFTFGYKKREKTKAKNQKNDAKKNNDLFKESLKCWNEKSNQCDSKSQSQKCKICRMAHQRINL